MLQAFSIIYLMVIVFLGCENAYLLKNIDHINALIAFLSLAFLCMAFLLHREKRLEDFGLSVLPIALILFLIYSAINFYFSSNADLSLYPTLKTLSALFLGIALTYFLQNTDSVKKALFGVFIFSGIIATSGIVEQFFPILMSINLSGLPASQALFTNPNFFAGYLLIHVPIGLYWYFRVSSAFSKNLIGLAWIFTLVSLGFSGSQAGQLIAGLQIVTTIWRFLIIKKPDQAKLVGIAALTSVLVYFGLKYLVLEPNLLTPMTQLAEPETMDAWVSSHVGIRLMFWLGAWQIFLEHWLLGSGLWTFEELYPQTQAAFRYLPTHAHNIYLQTASDTGLIGLGLLMTCLAALFSTLRRIFQKGSADAVEINFYIAISLTGFLIHNISEYNWLISNFIYYFVFLIISVEVLSRESRGQKKGALTSINKGFWPKAVIIIIVLGAFKIVQYYRYNEIIDHDILFAKTVEEILEHSERAKEICSQCGRPHYWSGIAHLEKYLQSKNDQSLTHAENDFNEAIRRSPNSLRTYLILAETRVYQGNYAEAKKDYIRTMKDPRHMKEALIGLKTLEKKWSRAEP